MRKTMTIAAAVLLLAACGGNVQKKADKHAQRAETAVPDGHTAQTSPDYTGTYTGTVPAADCPGIEMRLTLRLDGTYDLHTKYIDRDTEFDQTGVYTVECDLLTLDPREEAGTVQYYKVEENRVRMLDADRQPVQGALAENYVLHKTSAKNG